MSPQSPITAPSIDAVLAEFVESRAQTLEPDEARLYRHVILLLELCLNNYGHRNLDVQERALYEELYHDEEKLFFEVFGADKILAELHFFASTFLTKEIHTSERVVRLAPEVVAALRDWLVRKEYVPALEDEIASIRARERERAKRGSRRICRLLREASVSVDRASLTPADYIPSDHHLVQRTAPSKIWLSVYRSAELETVGPLLVPSDVTKRLRVGWSLHCALGRLRGRWHLVEVEGIHPRV